MVIMVWGCKFSDEVRNLLQSSSGVSDCSFEKVFDKHDEPVGCIAWSPDDRTLLTSAENIIKVWSVEVF